MFICVSFTCSRLLAVWVSTENMASSDSRKSPADQPMLNAIELRSWCRSAINCHTIGSEVKAASITCLHHKS